MIRKYVHYKKEINKKDKENKKKSNISQHNQMSKKI
jgi:hypothetical protein